MKAKITQRFEHVFLIGAFLLAGLLGHGPWKQDEPYIFGIVHHYLTSGTWLIPVNAGFPFLEKPPLYYWTAVVFCRLLGDFLPLPDAARLASPFYMLIAVFFQWKTARLLFASFPQARELGLIAVFLLLGSAGVVRFSHEMVTDVPLMAGVAIALYGMALLCLRPAAWRISGFWTGIGTGVAFLSKGVFMPGVLGLSGLSLLIFLPGPRARTTLYAVLLAFACALPFFLVWPWLLYRAAPALFHEWFWENNVGRFFGFSVARLGADNAPGYFLRVLPLFAFPASLLFIVALISCRKNSEWRAPYFLLPVSIIVMGLATLLFSASGRAQYLLPLLPPLALLGSLGLDRLSDGFRSGWNKGARFFFTLALAGVWLLWWALSRLPGAAYLALYARMFRRLLPLDRVEPLTHDAAYGFALLILAFWLYALKHWRKRSGLETARLWLAGLLVLWGSVYSLLLPWIDATRSYDMVFERMMRAAETPGCVETRDLGESIGPLYEYYAERHAIPASFGPNQPARCFYLFVSGIRNAPAPKGAWALIWKGARPLDGKDEELRLYRRAD